MRDLARVSLAVVTAACFAAGSPGADLRSDFADPPPQYKTRPLWFWNAPPDRAETWTIMERCQASGYYGFGILPTDKMGLEFMSAAYLDRYQEAVDKAAQLGLKMCLYDEFWFPSGSAGGQLAKRFPEALGRRLDLREFDLIGPRPFSAETGPGKLMAAVAMSSDTKERIDLTARAGQGRLEWAVPQGPWKVMLFTCVPDGARGLVDYLDPEAVTKYVSLTYERYYRRFPEHFGRTIDSAFYDEPTFHWLQGGRAWTETFNEKFEKKHGYSPAPLYPALWYDVGPETAAARNALFGLRAELFADGFIRTIADWCRQHRIELTGHVDQEEIVNPVGLCGDLIKAFKHQDIPGVDQIFQYGRGSKAYKVVSSAAANYDRPRVMCECYGAIKDMPVALLYKEAMDQFAKGINLMVPHAVWYSSAGLVFPPELSYKSSVYGPALPAYNQYMGRLQRVLQQGRHVAEIGVLYPIASLQAGYRFGVGTPYLGGIVPEEADYMDLGERLMLDLRHDFTFLHPEVLDATCTVQGAALRLNHPERFEQYRVLVIPGSTTIHLSNLRKIRDFYANGGRVVATTRLPDRSAEPGKDAEVRAIVEEIFGAAAATRKSDVASSKSEPGRVGPEEPGQHASGRKDTNGNAQGGKSWFVPSPADPGLRAVLDGALGVPDVAWEEQVQVAGGNLSYLHKVIGHLDVYFFANSSDTAVDTHVRLRGAPAPELWDPHTGRITPAEHSQRTDHGQPVTRLRLILPPVRSVFVVGTSPPHVQPRAE
jgi:hypothetical protein